LLRQQECRDDQDQHGSVDNRQEFHSTLSAVNDHSSPDPFRPEEEWPEAARDKGGVHEITDETSKREDKLAQLHQDLSRMLRSPQAA
jgi:hypothetical protein